MLEIIKCQFSVTLFHIFPMRMRTCQTSGFTHRNPALQWQFPHLKEAAVQQVAQHMSTLTACKTTQLQQHFAHECFTCGAEVAHQVAKNTHWQTCLVGTYIKSNPSVIVREDMQTHNESHAGPFRNQEFVLLKRIDMDTFWK